MALPTAHKRKLEDGSNGGMARKARRVRKQNTYSSGSSLASDGDAPTASRRGRSISSTRKASKRASNLPASALNVASVIPSRPRGGDQAEDDTKDADSEIFGEEEEDNEGEEGKVDEENEEARRTSGETDDIEDETQEQDEDENEQDDEDEQTDDSSSTTSATPTSVSNQIRSKRHDPTSFAGSLSAILGSKLSSSKRDDPVLSRSRAAHSAAHALADSKLELKAQRALRAERKSLADRGRVRDVLMGDGAGVGDVRMEGEDDDGGDENARATAAQIMEQERRLRKTAQRGVVKLFNAVRAAQVQADVAARKGKQDGVVGMAKREEKAGEMGRQAFLELVGGGGMEEG